MTRARVSAGRASVGEQAINLLALAGLGVEDASPEAIAGATHVAGALDLFVRLHTKK